METAEKTSKNRLRTFNDLLTIIVVTLAVYVILAPFLPGFSFWAQNQSPAKTWLSKVDDVQTESIQSPSDNRLFIPAIGLSEAVHEGGTAELKKGVVRRPHTSTPDKGSNTVMVGHRFAYGSRGVFYNLDKIKNGDEIVVNWNGHKYNYRVSDIKVVPPTEASVESATDRDTLTIYTCTPLWTVTDRLIIRAERVEEQ